jgi:hypothetical protein
LPLRHNFISKICVLRIKFCYKIVSLFDNIILGFTSKNASSSLFLLSNP